MTVQPVLPSERVAKLPHFPRLQWLRGLAALSVVLFHVSLLFSALRHYDAPAALFGWRFGRFGVVLFFVISGALMAELAPRTSVTRFLAHRAIRVYPIYWIALAAATMLRWTEGEKFPIDWRAMALIPGGHWAYPLGVEWTLPFEMTFYVIVAALIVLSAARRLQIIALIWLTGIAVTDVFAPAFQADWQFPTLLHLPLTDFSIGFACGLLVPWFVRVRRITIAAALFGIGMILGSEVYPALTMWMLAFGCTGLVAGAMLPQNRATVPARPLAALGNWSFALYLCHVPIILAVLHAVPGDVPSLPLWFATIAFVMALACQFGRFDVALHRRLRGLVDCTGPGTGRVIGTAAACTIILGGVAVILHWMG